ncbi:MAG: NAD(P)H-dependent oxidoreductase [Oleiphilaceae bacterium]|nr:NAD(P)H-dependent oxidoreductase [Oleiphilaceae bacterium]
MSQSVLVVNASVQSEHSVSRQLVNELLEQLQQEGRVETVVERDVANNDLELITANHVAAYYTAPQERDNAQHQLLQQSDALVAELRQASILVLGVPMYNFGVPAALKAWIDLVCRVGETFRYTENGPEGLLDIEVAYLVVATGGTPINSDADFVVPYLKQVARFLGVKRVEVIAADRVQQEQSEALAAARAAIKAA